jgi:hypothetical protein
MPLLFACGTIQNKRKNIKGTIKTIYQYVRDREKRDVEKKMTEKPALVFSKRQVDQ